MPDKEVTELDRTMPLITDDKIKEEINKYNLPEFDTDLEVIEAVCHIIAIVRTAQRDACQKVLEAKEREWKEKRLEYEKDFTSQIVTHTRRELKVEFAEWLENLLPMDSPLLNTLIIAYIAKLRKEGK